jgi:tRNA pseudouridine38-40 synthase
MRFKAVIEYDGSYFHGFQKQSPGTLTVQSALEKAIHALTQEEVTLTAAGRTDVGVHARGQVIHFDLSKDWVPYNIQQGLNFRLGEGAAVVSVSIVDDQFNARFSAIQRRYEYRVISRRMPLVLEKDRAWQVKLPLSIEKMQEAATLFCGVHNFNAFRSSKCKATRVIRALDTFEITQEGEYIICNIKARSFLYNQVRMMMGAVVGYALGKITADDIREALETGVKIKRVIPTAPACGLYFMEVTY